MRASYFVLFISIFACVPLYAGTAKLLLFDNLEKIKREYATKVGNDYLGNKDIADSLQGKKDEIYGKYRNIIIEAVDCGSAKQVDPIINLSCAINLYSKNKINDREFISSLPANKMSALWEIDVIYYKSREDKRRAMFPEISESGPVFYVIDVTHAIMKSGNKTAAAIFKKIASKSDGEYREYIFSKYPDSIGK